MRNDWINKPIVERLHWYENEISSLINYIENKQTISTKDIEEGYNVLNSIKKNLEIDNDVISSNLSSTNEFVRDYFTTVKGIKNDLDQLGLKPKNWYDTLFKSHQKIVHMNHVIH